MYSLRRTLAVRFSLTMFVTLLLIAGWALLASRAVVCRDVAAVCGDARAAVPDAGHVTRDLLWVIGITVVLATIATAFGAGWLAHRATRPVEEIARQARVMTAGVTGQRITAHADVQEFQDLIVVLNDMLERLDRGLESQRRLIADAGHELKTPLTAMRGELEIALRGARTPEQARTVFASVLDEVDHLSAISEALLVIAQLDADALTARRQPVDLVAMLDDAAGRWRERLDTRTLEVTHAAGDGGVLGDERLLRLSLDQLLDNACRHTPPGTAVRMGISRQNGDVALTVEDDGPGVPPDALPHLFDRFFRTDPARTRDPGRPSAGLGLTLVQAVADAHGGGARATLGPRGGLSVAVRLRSA